MYFNSLPFLAFMAAVLTLYYAMQVGGHYRAQNRLLLVASYIFYGGYAWEFCALLMLSTCLNYVFGSRIHRAGKPTARRWMFASLAFNLGMLGVFKYLDFFAENAAAVLGVFGLDMTWSVEHLLLPIGISFYTFQTLSYTIDIYRGRFRPVDDFLDFALFVVFFPQLVMGPIERAANLMPQIQKLRSPDSRQFLSGGWLIFLGLYKKVFIADQLARHCNPLFEIQSTYAGGDVLLGALLFTLQIYADFSGYSDIARGCARMLGFELMQNFRAPYFARNVQDYWNRWHISLTSWIRDYIFYPLAVNRRWATLLGAGGLSIVTMVIMGLWHNAGWMFVLWGVYHGVLLAAYGKLRPILFKHTEWQSAPAKIAWQSLCVLFTFCLVAFSELLFRPAGIDQSVAMIQTLFTNPVMTESTLATLLVAGQICAVLMVLDLCELVTDDHESVLSWPVLPRRVLQVFMLYSMVDALANHDTALGERFQYFGV